MKGKMKKAIALLLSVCLGLSGAIASDYSKNVKAENLINVTNGKNSTTYMTSNANTGKEGFLYIGNGFSNINTCNENLQNGNNMLGQTATTDEVALYVDLQDNYNISSALIYQGSTNANYYDSYCKKYTVYYSEQAVTVENQGNVVWNKAGECVNGTIYSSAKVKNASDVSETGDSIAFDNTYKARSVKIVFEKESCMGTGTNGNNSGTMGTVSLLSVRIYGVKTASENITTNGNSQQESTTGVEDDGVTDILFIGNSMTYYNTLCNVVGGIAKRKGHDVRCTAATNGGRNLIFQSTADNILQAIKKGGYEVVVLQDIVGSFDADRLQNGAEQIIPIIKQYNPNAKIMFYEPWPTKDKILGTSGLLPYFTYSYIQTAKSFGATLAPAGESFYELYNDNGLDYYCGDNKHPQPLGTFTSASTIYYALYPEEKYEAFTDNDQTYLDNLINTNVAYTNEGKQETYSLETLNLILSLGYKYAKAVIPAVKGNEKYVSAAGNYNDPDEGLNPDGLKTVKGKVVDSSVFTKANGNMAVGCKAYASNEKQAAANATDGNTGTRWETEYSEPQWLYVDLGSRRDFDTVGFIWEGAYAAKYYIQISDDASDWKTVSVVTASAAETVQIELSEKCSARYVRMYASKRGTGYGVSFYEIGVWKSEQEKTTTPGSEVNTTASTSQETTTTPTPTTVNAPTTVAPTTVQPTTVQPSTVQPTTLQPTTAQPTTVQSTTVVPTTTAKDSNTTTTSKPEETTKTVAEATTKVPSDKDKITSGTDDFVVGKAPGRVKKLKIKKKSQRKVSIKWQKIKKASGYQVAIRVGKKGKFKIQKKIIINQNYYIKSKLEKKVYYIKVRAYRRYGNVIAFGRYSKIKKYTVK